MAICFKFDNTKGMVLGLKIGNEDINFSFPISPSKLDSLGILHSIKNNSVEDVKTILMATELIEPSLQFLQNTIGTDLLNYNQIDIEARTAAISSEIHKAISIYGEESITNEIDYNLENPSLIKAVNITSTAPLVLNIKGRGVLEATNKLYEEATKTDRSILNHLNLTKASNNGMYRFRNEILHAIKGGQDLEFTVTDDNGIQDSKVIDFIEEVVNDYVNSYNDKILNNNRLEPLLYKGSKEYELSYTLNQEGTKYSLSIKPTYLGTEISKEYNNKFKPLGFIQRNAFSYLNSGFGKLEAEVASKIQRLSYEDSNSFIESLYKVDGLSSNIVNEMLNDIKAISNKVLTTNGIVLIPLKTSNSEIVSAVKAIINSSNSNLTAQTGNNSKFIQIFPKYNTTLKSSESEFNQMVIGNTLKDLNVISYNSANDSKQYIKKLKNLTSDDVVDYKKFKELLKVKGITNKKDRYKAMAYILYKSKGFKVSESNDGKHLEEIAFTPEFEKYVKRINSYYNQDGNVEVFLAKNNDVYNLIKVINDGESTRIVNSKSAIHHRQSSIALSNLEISSFNSLKSNPYYIPLMNRILEFRNSPEFKDSMINESTLLETLMYISSKKLNPNTLNKTFIKSILC